MLARLRSAPVVTASVIILLAIMILGWGAGRGSLRTATIGDVRADLADAGCILTADIQLGSAWQQLAFARVRDDARRQFKTIMRTKRRYMVENAVERQALGAELARTINRMARSDIAEQVRFSRFELF